MQWYWASRYSTRSHAPKKQAAASLRADNKGLDDRSRRGRSLRRRGRLAIGLRPWSISTNVIRIYIVYTLPFECNSSVRHANLSRPADDLRALHRSLRRGSSGDQYRCLRFAMRREGLERRERDRRGRPERRAHRRDRRDRCRPIARLAEGTPVKALNTGLMKLIWPWFKFGRNASRFVRSVVGP